MGILNKWQYISAKGLRMIFISVELWKEYVDKIKARRAIISLDPIKEKKEEVEMEPNSTEDSMMEENNNYYVDTMGYGSSIELLHKLGECY
ncbi:hypothetical protein Glove_19g227 [Diversispora epigaea]|uniref:Uncharacterized protein n=1 Tax=Diversispora epigaea TaxID=1348612 RepID=A0A397JKZ9_9GLOM|nr:hypothetical protein Glove_19g227 [Diversispora epigaea]